MTNVTNFFDVKMKKLTFLYNIFEIWNSREYKYATKKKSFTFVWFFFNLRTDLILKTYL